MTHLDPATVEACAKIVDAAMKSKDLGARSPKLIASAIRSLVSGEPQSSGGGVEGHAEMSRPIRSAPAEHPVVAESLNGRGHDAVIAGIKPSPSEAIPSGYADYTPVTVRAHTVPNSAKCTCPGDWQGMDHTSGCKSRASRTLVRKLVDDPNSASGKSLQYVEMTQDCAPAEAVSEEELARIINPGAFDDDPIERHKYCSPLTVDFAQQIAREKARALLSQFDVRRK